MKNIFLILVCCLMSCPAWSAEETATSTVQAQAQSRGLDRDTKLSGLRVAIRQAIGSERDRTKRRLLQNVLNDPDTLAITLAHVEWLQSRNPVQAQEGEEQGPVLQFLQFLIDNWDQIQKIIEFVSKLFASMPTAEWSPLYEQPDLIAIWGHRRVVVVDFSLFFVAA